MCLHEILFVCICMLYCSCSCVTHSVMFLDFMFHSLYLFKLGLAPQIQDLYGKVDFTGKSEHLFSSFLSPLTRLCRS